MTMMKCLYFLVFVAVSQASVIKENHVSQASQTSVTRPIFTIRQIIESPALGFTIQWIPATSFIDPITGYRLMVWEEVLPNTNRFRNFQELYIRGAKTIAAVAEIQPGRWYQYNIQAFTERGTYGPQAVGDAFMLVPQRSDGRQESVTYTVVERKNSEK